MRRSPNTVTAARAINSGFANSLASSSADPRWVAHRDPNSRRDCAAHRFLSPRHELHIAFKTQSGHSFTWRETSQSDDEGSGRAAMRIALRLTMIRGRRAFRRRSRPAKDHAPLYAHVGAEGDRRPATRPSSPSWSARRPRPGRNPRVLPAPSSATSPKWSTASGSDRSRWAITTSPRLIASTGCCGLQCALRVPQSRARHEGDRRGDIAGHEGDQSATCRKGRHAHRREFLPWCLPAHRALSRPLAEGHAGQEILAPCRPSGIR